MNENKDGMNTISGKGAYSNQSGMGMCNSSHFRKIHVTSGSGKGTNEMLNAEVGVFFFNFFLILM